MASEGQTGCPTSLSLMHTCVRGARASTLPARSAQVASGGRSWPGGGQREDRQGSAAFPRVVPTPLAHRGWREGGGLECSMAGKGPHLPSVAQAHLEAGGAGREEGDAEVGLRGCWLDGHLPGCGD